MIKKLLHQNQTADGWSDTEKKKIYHTETRLNVECFKMIKKRGVIYFDDRNDNLQ